MRDELEQCVSKILWRKLDSLDNERRDPVVSLCDRDKIDGGLGEESETETRCNRSSLTTACVSMGMGSLLLVTVLGDCMVLFERSQKRLHSLAFDATRVAMSLKLFNIRKSSVFNS